MNLIGVKLRIRLKTLIELSRYWQTGTNFLITVAGRDS